MELLIKNAEVFDGVHEEPRKAWVLVRGDRIDAVLDSEPAGYNGEVLDATGLVLSPGFIDTHSHNDFYAVLPEAQRYCRPFVEQGITSQITGNCGFSIAGIDPATPHGKDLFAFFINNPDYKPLCTFSGWAAAVDRYSPLNTACLAGHGSIRTSLRGLGAGALSADELAKMDRLLEQSLEAGNVGVSYGLMYDPGMYGSEEELLRLAKIAARYDRIITFHQRALSRFSLSYPELFGRAHNLRALDEVLRIAEHSKARTQISHVIFVGRSTWNTLDETVRLIDNANTKGLDVGFDIYPYDFGASTITVALPSWYQALGPAEQKKAFTRFRLGVEIFATKKLLGFGFDDIQVTWAGPKYSDYAGKRISELAREWKCGDIDAYLKVIGDSKGEATVLMYSYMNDHIINVLSRHRKTNYMTDAWLMDQGTQNAAAYGAFPRFLRLSREGKAEKLGKMLCKMTSVAADRFGLKNRGRIEAGCFADLVLFDKNTVADQGEKAPVGLPHVIINGEFAVKDGAYQNKALGRALAAGR